jgi:hypothetical protein
MTCNTKRAINHKEMYSKPERLFTSKRNIYLISNLGIINLDFKCQVKNVAHKFAGSMANEFNYHKLVASVPKSILNICKSVSPLPWSAHLSDDGERATSPNSEC